MMTDRPDSLANRVRTYAVDLSDVPDDAPVFEGTTCMLHKPHRWANLWGGREGRVGDRWVSRATALDCTVGQYDTPLAALVAPNGYKGTRPASASVEDINHYFIGRSNMVVTARG